MKNFIISFGLIFFLANAFAQKEYVWTDSNLAIDATLTDEKVENTHNSLTIKDQTFFIYIGRFKDFTTPFDAKAELTKMIDPKYNILVGKIQDISPKLEKMKGNVANFCEIDGGGGKTYVQRGIFSNPEDSYVFEIVISYPKGKENKALEIIQSVHYYQGNSIPASAFEEVNETEILQKEFTINAIDIINKFRASGCKCGEKQMPPVEPLSYNENLQKAAKAHTSDMVERNFYDHISPEPALYGTLPSERISFFGYIAKTSGENLMLMVINATAENCVAAWQKSTGHCLNMMNGEFTEIGIADYMGRVTAVFGAPHKNFQNVITENLNSDTLNGKKIIVYGNPECGKTKHVLETFNENKIGFLFCDAHNNPMYEAEMKYFLVKNGDSDGNNFEINYPVIVIDKNKIFNHGSTHLTEILKIVK
jgi:uncharacterized protein YkwD/glutaredoxin